jgi:hypothetical protein
MCENRTIDEGDGECRFRVGLCLSQVLVQIAELVEQVGFDRIPH